MLAIRGKRRPMRRVDRRGVIAVIIGLLLFAILGFVACAFDTGYLAMTRTQLHTAADAGALAGGTELLAGLGYNATASPAEVQAAATAAAVEFAGRNRAGDASSCYCDAARDVILGTAVYDPAAGAWVKTPGATPYNYVQVNLHRDQAGSQAGDGQLPLFFSPFVGVNEAPVSAYATAVILPASGIFIEEGSDDTAGLLPFAFREEVWRQLELAQKYFNGELNHPDYSPGEMQNLVLNAPEGHELLSNSELGAVVDPATGTPLFGETFQVTTGPPANQGTHFQQLFFDQVTINDGVVSLAGDGVLEVDIYPHREPDPSSTGGQGNFGTIDFGSTDNSTQTLARQIAEGLNAEDLSYYEGNQFSIDYDEPLLAEGDTGISTGIESALEGVLGDCRAIVLFSATGLDSGNNYTYSLVDIVGAAVVEVELNSGDKRLFIQRCTFTDDNLVADTDEEIGEDDSVFTPLILIE